MGNDKNGGQEVLWSPMKSYEVLWSLDFCSPDVSWRPPALGRASTGSPIRATRAWSVEPEPVEPAETREPGDPDVAGNFMMFWWCFQDVPTYLRLKSEIERSRLFRLYLFMMFCRVISTLGVYAYQFQGQWKNLRPTCVKCVEHPTHAANLLH